MISCIICSSLEVKEIITFESGVKIFDCKKCRNAFTYPKPKLPDYSKEDFHRNGLETNELTLFEHLPIEIQESYRIQKEMIVKHVPRGAHVLEVGGGEGLFLELLKNSGYNVELIEPSVTASIRAQKRGLNVYNDYLKNVKFPNKYSVICLAHVLEHIENPAQTMEALKNMLEPNGFVLLTQSNYKGFMPYLLKKSWYAWLPSQHFSHFTVSGIKYLAQSIGFKVVSYKHSRLVHWPSIYHKAVRFVPKLQDQIHVLLQLK